MTAPTIRCRKALCAALVLVVALLPSAALADVARHNVTGEEIEGKLTKQQISGMHVFELAGGGKRFIKLNEWEVTITEASEPKAEPVAADSGETAAGAAKGKIYIIPISGAIEHVGLIQAIEKAVKEAKTFKSDAVVFRMNTPGGRVDVAAAIISAIEGITWARTAAWVQGDEHHALSAGAYISLSTEAIYMEDAASIGAAVPFRVLSGSAEVDEKMQSAFRAKFRAMSEKRGHLKILADAMVDTPDSDIVQVFIGDEMRVVTREDAANLKKEHGEKFKMGNVVCGKGKILTMTTKEALELTFIQARVNDRDQLTAALGFDSAVFKEADWITEQVKKAAEENQEKFEKLRNEFNKHIQLAMDNDPRRNLRALEWRDGGQAWRQCSQKCLAHLKVCAQALLEIEKMSNDKTIDVDIPQEFINDAKTSLDTFYRRVNDEKDITRRPYYY